MRARPLGERFWEKVATTDDPDDCWTWTAAKSVLGYGKVRSGAPTRRMLMAHRVSYALAHGIDPISMPAEMVIMHDCDNPPCVNPSHLTAGTAADNSRDMARKGRARNDCSWVDGRCVNGHDVTRSENWKHRDGRLECRQCYLAYQAAYNERRRLRVAS